MIEQTNLAKLQKEASRLHYKIVNTQFPPEKRPLQEKRAKILQKINAAQLKIEEEREAKAIKDLDHLFNTHKNGLIIEVNGYRKQLTEDLTITLKFTPCGHKHPLHIRELLRFQRNIELNSVLLAKWQSLLSTNLDLEARFNCDQCRRRIEQKFNKTRVHSPRDSIGTAIVTLQKL